MGLPSSGAALLLYLDPKEPTFFRVPDYEFFIKVLKRVGYFGG